MSITTLNIFELLSPINKRVLGLRYMTNFTYKEIAEALSMTEQEVSKRMFEARKEYKRLSESFNQ
ncbi:hypothetical protein BHU72_13095 [Desulfuribacillus stibiiarsenatis]|uniref:RNA polymerase sigma-70 region 4 domain-containing protein n=1 Tax=Desulfuribacillus stibiiarsenatis TaxID=1390249 RepID=A0A1E5L971_9FIRM|nr:sigma factor-like helix-turn-helix DNA-binding protein [Desulfuribacillus stibiiarsenatis]OEH86539.1 hypothetical protein BHU72_13095 [Desulfuribacillus stibiiarsenatis]